jgi:hypothetical protein
MEREKVREREPAAAGQDFYETIFAAKADARRMAVDGRVVIRGKDLGWQQGRQGLVKFYLTPHTPNIPVNCYSMFVHDIRTHSGMHKHQGGLVIFVLEGEGYTLLNGQRVDWEAGDLLLLPIIPGGIAHQHFNRAPGRSCKWLAITYGPYSYIMGSMFEQKELSPDWKESHGKPKEAAL